MGLARAYAAESAGAYAAALAEAGVPEGCPASAWGEVEVVTVAGLLPLGTGKVQARRPPLQRLGHCCRTAVGQGEISCVEGARSTSYMYFDRPVYHRLLLMMRPAAQKRDGQQCCCKWFLP